jgi:hypothetical protein
VAVTKVDHSVHPAQIVPGLAQFNRDIRKLGPEFQKALRKGNIEVASMVVQQATQRASTPAERAVARGLRARPDRIPKIDVSTSRMMTSRSRPNPRRTEAGKARIIDVWFGTEFGGGKYRNAGSDTNRIAHKGRLVRKGGGYTTQFRPHRGTQGYFFYPTVREMGPRIVERYAQNISDVEKQWRRGRL